MWSPSPDQTCRLRCGAQGRRRARGAEQQAGRESVGEDLLRVMPNCAGQPPRYGEAGVDQHRAGRASATKVITLTRTDHLSQPPPASSSAASDRRGPRRPGRTAHRDHHRIRYFQSILRDPDLNPRLDHPLRGTGRTCRCAARLRQTLPGAWLPDPHRFQIPDSHGVNHVLPVRRRRRRRRLCQEVVGHVKPGGAGGIGADAGSTGVRLYAGTSC